MGDAGICVKAHNKMFDRFEQVDKCVVTGIHALGRLIHVDVVRIAYPRGYNSRPIQRIR